jgi:hypothetical protein
LLAEFFQYREDFPARPPYVVVDNHVSSDLLAPLHLFGGAGETCGDVFIAVAAPSKTAFELFHGGCDDEKDDGGGSALDDLFGALHFNFEQHLGTFGRTWTRRAVEVAVKLRPLEEGVLFNRTFERLAIDEVILTAVFSWSNRSRRPTLAQPQGLIVFDQLTSERAFAHTTGTNEYCDEGLSGQEPETVPRAA